MRISRRQALQIPMVGAVVVAAGCGRERTATPPPPDPLIELAAQARFDADFATSAIATNPDDHAALTEIAAQRTAHAEALETEVARLARPSATTTPMSTPADISFTGDLPTLLRRSQLDAAATARKTHGYRAGLLASISAACAVQIEVLVG